VPTFDVTVQGKTYRVEVPDPGAAPLQVIVDGQPFEVGIVGAEVPAAPAPRAAEPPRSAPRPTIPVSQPTQAGRPAPVASAAGTAGGKIGTAPMPGTILSVEATVGQRVESGQVLCVLEAMKMKNPIRAVQASIVAEILVQPGQTVSHGAALVRLE
jgi:biotin carboxyl carrier protein